MIENIEKFMESNKQKIKFCGAQNPYIKFVKNLNNNTKSNQKQEIVVEGVFQHKLLIENNIKISCVFFCPELITSQDSIVMLNKLADKTDILLSVSEKIMQIIAEVDSGFGIVTISQIPQIQLSDLKMNENSTIVVLDGVEIPGNLGTILRTCDGAGVDAVFLTNKKTRITHPKCVRSSLGAVFTLPVFSFEKIDECIDFLKSHNYKILLADTRAQNNYFDYDYMGKIAIVMGSERYGIVKEWYNQDYIGIKIPQLGKCDSLNVANACTILIYEARMKQTGLMKRK